LPQAEFRPKARWVFFGRLKQRHLLVVAAIAPAHGFDDSARINTLVDVERDRRHLERSALSFPCPNQLRIEMRIGFTTLLREFPTLRLTVDPDQVPFRHDMAIFGVHGLEVAW